jgi:hypothetical protein
MARLVPKVDPKSERGKRRHIDERVLEILRGWEGELAGCRAMAHRYAGTAQAALEDARAERLIDCIEDLLTFFPNVRAVYEDA